MADGSESASTRHQAVSASSSATQVSLDIRKYFRGSIDPVPTQPGYVIGLVFASIAIVLLPILYLALTSLVGFAVYWHATEHSELVTSGKVRLWRLLLYAGPIVAGTIGVLFMLKPFLARRRHEDRTYALEPMNEPSLFNFVHCIASAIGAPMPAEIEVTASPTASASFRGGLMNLFSGRLVLTIGMPLVAGMDSRQLAGVIAHELGHFSQRTAMRASLLVRYVNNWLAGAVYRRDALDDWLDDVLKSDGAASWLYLVFLLAKGIVKLSRAVIYVFMLVGHAISFYLLRQMEFSADRYEISLAGSEVFEHIFRRLHELSESYGWYMDERLHLDASAGRLPDNLPDVLAAISTKRRSEIAEEINQILNATSTKWHDTHPPNGVRIARARSFAAPGVFTLAVPASKLVRHYTAICRWVTIGAYQERLKTPPSADRLVPSEKIIRTMKLDASAQESLDRMTRGIERDECFIVPAKIAESDDRVNIEALKKTRNQLIELDAALPDAAQRADQFAHQMQLRRMIQRFQRSGILPRHFHEPDADFRRAARPEDPDVRRDGEAARHTLERAQQLVETRLGLGIALLATGPIQQKLLKGAMLHRHARAIADALQACRELQDSFQILNDGLSMSFLILHQDLPESVSEARSRLILTISEEMYESLSLIKGRFRGEPYPLEHTTQNLTLSQLVIDLLPPAENPKAIAMKAHDVLRRTQQLRKQLLQRLSLIVEKAEAAANLTPLNVSPRSKIDMANQ